MAKIIKLFGKDKNNEFGDKIPLAGGNTRIVKNDLEVQNTINNSTLPYQALQTLQGYFSNKFKSEQYDIWRLLMFQANYFCNVFSITTDNIQLNNAIQIAKRAAFIYGWSGIYKLGNRLIPVYFISKKLGYDGNIISCKIASAITILQQQTERPKTNNVWTLDLDEQEIAENMAVLKWDTMALGAWYTFLPFINQQKRLLTMLAVEGYTLNKKFDLSCIDPSVITKELDIFFNEEIPAIVSHKFQGDISNRISINELSKNSGVNQFIEYYKFWEQHWYQTLGRRYNADFKKERNISNEIEATQTTFDVLESEILIYHKDFANKLHELTGFNISVNDDLVNAIIKEVENEI